MAHLVTLIDKIAAYDDAGSWHGLMTENVGQPKTLEEAFERSGLDWPVNVTQIGRASCRERV